MPEILPRLRAGIDMMPSADPNQPGILLRDPFHYAEVALFLPASFAAALPYLDGMHTDLDIQEVLTRQLGQLVFSSEVRKLVGILREQGFLETAEFERRRERKQADFRAAAERQPVHAGTGYPAAPEELRALLDRLLQNCDCPEGLAAGAMGLAAPHVSIEGGGPCYAASYAPLVTHPELAERTFVLLGTSHYGQPDTFGLTRKPFATPLGELAVDTALVDWLEQHAGEAVTVEDYCHAVEHSIEFQCLFLQHVLDPSRGRPVAAATVAPTCKLRILPILCGPLSVGGGTGLEPVVTAPVLKGSATRFFEALAQMAEREGDRLFWVLGIDLAHVGRRYGDRFSALAGRGLMDDVAGEDRARLELVCSGDAGGFFQRVYGQPDELNWCGSSALYTFLKAVPQARGRLLRYQQWNIDLHSVVSFASLQFFPLEARGSYRVAA